MCNVLIHHFIVVVLFHMFLSTSYILVEFEVLDCELILFVEYTVTS